MKKIDIGLIKECVYRLLLKSNVFMPKSAYDNFLCSYMKNKTSDLEKILKNAELAAKNNRPLCQDTGQVIVFLKIGQNVFLDGEFIETAINETVAKCYKNNFYRKSVVKNALFDRKNTTDNTPVIIHTEITDTDYLEINLMVKGGGAENMSKLYMLTPTTTEDEIIKTVSDAVKLSGTNSCPPLFLGIGIGGTAEKAMLLSKKAFFTEMSPAEYQLAQRMKSHINKNIHLKNINDVISDIKILTNSTHIASLPLAITFNCHCLRHAGCKILENKIIYSSTDYTPEFVKIAENSSIKINSDEVEKIKMLKKGMQILLSGEIYTARDAAHQRIVKLIDEKKTLPINLKNKIIFYAGPCPNKPNEIIGPVGPTTSKRMDKFTEKLLKNNILATIGKGERSTETEEKFKKYNTRYFTLQGGIANYVAQCVTSAEVVAFNDLGAEAIYKLTVADIPLEVIY